MPGPRPGPPHRPAALARGKILGTARRRAGRLGRRTGRPVRRRPGIPAGPVSRDSSGGARRSAYLHMFRGLQLVGRLLHRPVWRRVGWRVCAGVTARHRSTPAHQEAVAEGGHGGGESSRALHKNGDRRRGDRRRGDRRRGDRRRGGGGPLRWILGTGVRLESGLTVPRNLTGGAVQHVLCRAAAGRSSRADRRAHRNG